jgi:hypothetical protein
MFLVRSTSTGTNLPDAHNWKRWPAYAPQSVPVLVLYPSSRDLSPAARAFVDWAHSAVGTALSPHENAALQSVQMLGYTRKLKALHEQEHPKSKGGRPSRTVPKAGKVSKPERFTMAHAKRTARSEAAVQQDVAEATALGDDMMKKIVGTSLDKPSEITALSAMDEQERQQ